MLKILQDYMQMKVFPELKLKIVLPGKTCLAVPGDWILLDPEGKISVLSHDEFVRTYREVNDG